MYGVAGFERQFAIKRFHNQLVGEPDRAAQLAQAARLYGALEHPRIARMHEFGVAGGETFTATELVRGVDLAQLCDATFGAGRPLPAGAAVALLSAAARAVGFAHGRGLAHLGLCPTNVLCTAEGDVKVTDFGFLPLRLPARPATDSSLLARLPYLAPEQHRGETGTPATDVFQLGLLAYELLRGEPALVGGGAAAIEERALSGEPAPLGVPKALGHVVRRALARSPYERFPDAGAMADALDAAVRATPLPGDRRDLAGLVRNALDQQAQMHETQMSGALRLPVPAPPPTPRPSQQLTAETPVAATLRAPSPSPAPPPSPGPTRAPTPPPTPPPAAASSGVPIAVPVAKPPAGPPPITRRPTPLPQPVARKTPPPIPAAAAPAPDPVPEPVKDPASGAPTRQMGALSRPVVPPASLTGKIPKIPGPAIRGAGGAVPPPPDSGPGRSGLGSGRSGSATGPLSATGPAGGSQAGQRRPTPLPSLPRAPQTRPRVATPPPIASEPEARTIDSASRADTTVPGIEAGTEVGTEVGTDVGTEVGTDVRTNVGTDVRTNVGTDVRTSVAGEPRAGAGGRAHSAVPIKLTDTQPGTGPTTLPAQRKATPRPPTPEPDDPFGGPEQESDPDIFAGLFDESSGENASLASQMPSPAPPATGAAPASAAAAPEESDAEDGDGDGDDLPSPTQEMEADEPPILRTLVGHVPITGATNGTRPATASPTRSSNIIPRKREQPAAPAPPAPAPATSRPASETEPPDPGEVTVPRRSAAVRRVLPTAPPDDAFERDTGMHEPAEEASSSILQAAARAADMGLAQPVAPAPSESRRPLPPGPESVEIEIVRPHLEPELGAIPTPLPGAATLPDMNYPQAPVGYMPAPPPYQPPMMVRPSGGAGRTALKLLLVVFLLGGMAAGGYFGYMALVVGDDDSGQSTTAAAPTPPDPAAGKAPALPAAAGDAGAAATPPPTPGASDAGPTVPPTPTAPPTPGDATDLSISSTPPDAKVYLDGAPVGKTPMRLDGSGDRHKLALILPGYKLHTAEIEGKGAVQVDLQEVTPSSGPAGIKVKCKAKNRYYVIVDGVDTGQTCPTERIGSTLGEHNVEVYDPETDSRKSFPINIEQTRLSHRVKVDY